ncbi:MAG: winged helix-turn-helix transcriptional regulator [Elusimicrobia bacterium]|nr:winged helix-turn-helix transcriptional regulator [Elusimicrobiota bacterium]
MSPHHEGNGTLAQKELALIQELARRPAHTQRSLSRSLGLALGTTNLLIKRLAGLGLIRVQPLDSSKARYHLTVKGSHERNRAARLNWLATVRNFRRLRDHIGASLEREYARGRREFFLVVDEELLEVVQAAESSLRCPGATFTYLRRFSELPPEAGLAHAATLEPAPPGREISWLIDYDGERLP